MQIAVTGLPALIDESFNCGEIDPSDHYHELFSCPLDRHYRFTTRPLDKKQTACCRWLETDAQWHPAMQPLARS